MQTVVHRDLSMRRDLLRVLTECAVVVGGVNILGGSGTAIGAALGAILLGTIENALSILNLNAFWLQAIQGAVIIAAVSFDALVTRRLQRALRQARART